MNANLILMIQILLAPLALVASANPIEFNFMLKFLAK
jgi:hypothetical protein